MPSQIVTTFGSYATAPSQIVLFIIDFSPGCAPTERGHSVVDHQARRWTTISCTLRSEQRHSQGQPGNELAKYVARRRHHRTRMGVAEQSLDVHVLRECRASAYPH